MIPKTAHFVWLGRETPWTHLLAVASAAQRGGFERVLFHHTDELAGAPVFDRLAGLERVEARRLEPLPLLERAGGAALVDCYRDLSQPAAKSNVLRVCLMAEQGGVYLDTDTLTLASLAPLCERGGAFCGEERLIFPVQAARGITSRLRPSALARMAVRDLFRRLPEGYRGFRRVEQHYPSAPNNAVLGAERAHPFLAELLARMSALPKAERRVRYALGTHLLQAAVREWSRPGLTVLPPAAFFPLGPEISEHYFRIRPSLSLEDAIGPDTLVAHWYASVRTERHVAFGAHGSVPVRDERVGTDRVLE
ncbi:MAG TPA: glycosyltransferase, partial [Polyangiaceae bacterium]